MKINCVVIDDEYSAIELIEEYISRVPELELKKSFDSAFEAYSYINSNQVDLMFLDIEMPEMNGFHLLQVLNYRPYVIITSAYSQYALFAYEIAINDYLLKPLSFERFLIGIEKIKKLFEKDRMNLLLGNNYIKIKTGWETEKIFIDDILYVKGLQDNLSIYTNYKRIVTLMTFQELIQKLPKDNFLRIHKSFLVALDKIDRFNSKRVQIGSVDIPIGRTYKQDFFYKMEEIH